MIVIGSAIDADLLRLRNEYLSQRALVLTVPQVARLLDIGLRHAQEILSVLEEEGFLAEGPFGSYRRPEAEAA